MWEEIFGVALSNGLLSALFVALLIYVMRDTARREKKHQEMEQENRSIIAKLSERLKVVTELKNIMDETHKDLRRPTEEKEKT
jgi:hypothetical protein